MTTSSITTSGSAVAAPPPGPLPDPLPGRRFRLAPRARRRIAVLHIVASVAILGLLWVNAVLAVLAMRADGAEQARTVYLTMLDLVFTTAVPLSMVSLVTGMVLGLGTKWGVLRFRWVTAKLVLLLLTVLTGSTVQHPLLERLVTAPSAAVQGANLAVTAGQFGLLTLATWLSVVKPGGRFRRFRR